MHFHTAVTSIDTFKNISCWVWAVKEDIRYPMTDKNLVIKKSTLTINGLSSVLEVNSIYIQTKEWLGYWVFVSNALFNLLVWLISEQYYNTSDPDFLI